MNDKIRESRTRANKVLIGAIILMIITLGSKMTHSNFINSICAQTGADITSVSVIFSIMAIVSAVTGLVSAFVIDRIPIKWLALFGVICYAIFYLCCAFADSLIPLYLGSVCFGLCQVFAGNTLCQALIMMWHTKNTGKKVSYLAIAQKVTAVVLSPLVVWLIASVGFRNTMLINGLGFAVIGVLAVFFLISNKPESYGLAPYGDAEGEGVEAADASSEDEEIDPATQGITAKQALKTLPFWMVFIASFLLAIPVAGFTANGAIMFQACGYDEVGAATLISVYSLLSIVAAFIYGWLSDKSGPRTANTIFIAFCIVALLIYAVMSGHVAGIVLALAFAVMSSFAGMVGVLAVGPLYGPRAMGPLVSLVLAAMGLGSTIAPVLSAGIYSATGSFTGFMFIGIGALVLTLIILMYTNSKKTTEKMHSIKPEA